ncbi:DUF3558 domain-containing protein [Streptomyces phaeochromogenes]|uniref:DUF3558 domain-containing protein n=1 Tax=Streptomyces phaeochromogenes TaxID=1923 RepID=A0ABZ1HEP1_STRPH|nr:DUF3558 domain-containing protein [Streptomyces phaeochromogenes]WSD17070.1 DUF3558 domain-containing protein [Streptomyces phaeochromogenes]
MQRKAYVPGVAALLAVLLAGCTGGSGNDDGTTDPKPGESATTPTAAQPGKYRTLPEPCAAVSHGTLDSLLPGIKQVTDEEQREKAYEGTATQTYDTDRKVGCRWKAQSTGATDHLLVDFERVVSYDNAVSDDDRATDIYLKRETAADLPEPVASSESSDASESPESSSSSGSSPDPSGSPSGDSGSGPSSSSSGAEGDDESGSATPSDGSTPSALQPRTLDDLGDEAFLDDALSSSRQRTVTVVFRTSNVVVTIQYDEQPATTTDVPSSKDMQDRARKLAGQLAGTFDD